MAGPTPARAAFLPGTSLRSIYALTALVALALIPVSGSWGIYTRETLASAVIGLGAALAACSWPAAVDATRPAPPLGLFAAVAVILSGLAAVYAQADDPGAAVVTGAAWAGVAATGSLLLHFRQPLRPWVLPAQVLVLFLAGGLLRAAAVAVVPDPKIDVYVALRDAPDHLLRGRNPYTAAYTSPNDHPFEAYPFYPPLPLLVCTPFRAAGLDVRYANVVCDLLAALVLVLAGRGRGHPLLGTLAAATYLNLPRVPLLIGQAWYEPMLAACAGGGLWLAERGRWAGWLLLGLGVTGKQSGLVMLPPLWKAMRGRRWRLLAGVGAAAVGIILPFFLWDPGAFLDVVVFKHLERPVHLDSITLRSGLHDLLTLRVPGAVMLGLMAVGVGWVTWRTPRGGTATALWLGTALLIFFLCHTQAYCNYFYLCDYLLLLGVVGLAPPAKPASLLSYRTDQGTPA